jgi:hypothetical protein
VKLTSFFADGREHFGALRDRSVVDFTGQAAGFRHAAGVGLGSVLALIEAGGEGTRSAKGISIR